MPPPPLYEPIPPRPAAGAEPPETGWSAAVFSSPPPNRPSSQQPEPSDRGPGPELADEAGGGDVLKSRMEDILGLTEGDGHFWWWLVALGALEAVWTWMH